MLDFLSEDCKERNILQVLAFPYTAITHSKRWKKSVQIYIICAFCGNTFKLFNNSI